MLVRLIKDWKDPDIFRQTPASDGVWDGVTFTFEPVNDCDYLIVLTRPPYDISVNCKQGNVWLVSFEPPSTFHKFHLKSYRYFDKIISQNKEKVHYNHHSYQSGLPWHIDKSYHDLLNLPIPEKKINRVSCVVSNLNWMKGHEVRLEFIKYLKRNNFDLELFGRGIRPVQDKFEALYPFKYSIAIENSVTDHYWTEKIADCFLSWTMPIYYGCPNIHDYFPKESLIKIDPTNPKQAIKSIRKAIEEDYWSKNIDAIAEARNSILSKYQFFPQIVNEIKKNEILLNPDRPKTRYNIPHNPAPWESEYKSTIYRKIEYRIRKLLNIKPY